MKIKIPQRCIAEVFPCANCREPKGIVLYIKNKTVAVFALCACDFAKELAIRKQYMIAKTKP